MMKVVSALGWGGWTHLTLLMAVIAARYLSLDPAEYFPGQVAVYLSHQAAITLHVAGGLLATVLGPFQFIKRLRVGRWLRLHRWTGRLYLIGIGLGGLFGFYMTFVAYGGLSNKLGFGLLALTWLYTGYQAYATIRRREVDAHRAWMIRNYSLTFGAILLRLWLGVFQVAGLDFDTSYALTAWVAWVPHLIVAEVIISSTYRVGRGLQGRTG